MKKAPYGTWKSPITAEQVASAIIAFQDVVVDGEDIYWSEMRPYEKGRYAIVKQQSDGSAIDVLPPEFNARTRVHEYGGAAFTVEKGIIYFTNYADQRLYQIKPGQVPSPLTEPGIRFAEYHVTALGIIAIAESHQPAGEPENFIACINPQTGSIKKLCSGQDFYSSLALNANKTKIAWISWDHPNMPWDNTALWVADLTDQSVVNAQRIDEKFTQQSFFQPQWGPNDELIVVSDKSNWWNLYRVKGQSLEILFTVESELGTPLWTLGQSTWGFYQGGIVCSFSDKPAESKQLRFVKNGQITTIPLPYTHFSQIRTTANQIICIAGAADWPTAVISVQNNNEFKVLRENCQLSVASENISKAEHLTFPSKNGREAHAYFYLPCNPEYQETSGLPPLIVKSHGGPTAQATNILNLEIQYWTSRGYAVADVNYGGSTGYGREYRERLLGNWGIVDVQDCEALAQHLVKTHQVAPNKLAIVGGSAGGYTTLAALTFTQTFHVGASYYGVSDCGALAEDTHKFESNYLERLIGPYPQAKATYEARSPLYHVDQLNSPVIFFQGLEDKIVPPDQAEKMYQALKAKGIPTELFLFEGEQHGFRNAQNRQTVLVEQQKFFNKVLKLEEPFTQSSAAPEILAVKSVSKTQIFHVEQISLRFSNGVVREFERLKVWDPGVVMIVAMLDPETVILTKEYAAGVNDYIISLPKGRVEHDEDIFTAANRELQEEVGYAAKKFTYLSQLTTSPNYSATITHIILAEDLTPSILPADEPEPIGVVPWPLADIATLLQRSDFHEARAIAALYLAKQHLEK
ncbi:MAG: ADP compounds hydrolase NudE [Candidatus Berkiellales bacterium]